MRFNIKHKNRDRDGRKARVAGSGTGSSAGAGAGAPSKQIAAAAIANDVTAADDDDAAALGHARPKTAVNVPQQETADERSVQHGASSEDGRGEICAEGQGGGTRRDAPLPSPRCGVERISDGAEGGEHGTEGTNCAVGALVKGRSKQEAGAQSKTSSKAKSKAKDGRDKSSVVDAIGYDESGAAGAGRSARASDGPEGKSDASTVGGGPPRKRTGAHGGCVTKICPACGESNPLSRLSCVLCAAKFSVKQTSHLLQQRHAGDGQTAPRFAELEVGLDPEMAGTSADPASAEITAEAFKLLPEEAQIQVILYSAPLWPPSMPNTTLP